MKKLTALLLVVVVLASFLAACAAPTPQVVEKEVVVEKPVPVTVEVEKEVVVEKKVVETVEVVVTATPAPVVFDWKKYAGTTIYMTGLNIPYTTVPLEHLAEFEELTGIKVVTDLPAGHEYYHKTVLMLTTAPEKIDVVEYHPETQQWKFLGEGFLEDLYPFINDPSLTDADNLDFDDLMEGAIKSLSSKDGKKLYGIPYANGPGVWCYRKDIYEEKGLKVPETLEELEANIAATHDPDNEFYGFVARGIGWQAVHPFAFAMRAFGAYYLDEAGEKAAINSPEFIQAVEYYGGLLRKYGPPGAVELDDAKCVALFSQGLAAHTYMPNSYQMAFADPEKSKVSGKIAWFLAPKGPSGEVTDANGPGSMAISTYSKNKEAAWYFIQWFTNKENQLRIQMVPEVSCRRSAWENPEYLAAMTGDFAEYVPIVKQVCIQGIGNSFPPAEDLYAAREAIGITINVAIEGGDVKAAADKANADYQALLDAAGGVPDIY